MDRRSSGRLDSEVLAVHVCNLTLEMVMVSMKKHFVEVRVYFDGVWKPGIGNADPVLPDLQGIC